MNSYIYCKYYIYHNYIFHQGVSENILTDLNKQLALIPEPDRWTSTVTHHHISICD